MICEFTIHLDYEPRCTEWSKGSQWVRIEDWPPTTPNYGSSDRISSGGTQLWDSGLTPGNFWSILFHSIFLIFSWIWKAGTRDFQLTVSEVSMSVWSSSPKLANNHENAVISRVEHVRGTPQFPIFTILEVLLAPFRETWTIFCGNDLNQRPIGAPGNRFTFHWKTAICMRASFCLYSLNMLNSHFHLHCEDERLRINILAWFEYSMQLNSDNCTNRWASSL